MIHIYKYSRIVPIFRNVSNEGLENTNTMFNDSITLHRNVDNVLNFKLTDRDRRSINIDNQNIMVKIIDDHSTLIVDTFYLSPTENAKIFKVEIPSNFVNQLLPRRGYSFSATIIGASGKEEPLYIDHDFMMNGSIEVVDNYSEVTAKKYEGYSLRIDALEKDVDGEYVLDEYIEVDDDFIKVEFKTYDDQTSLPISVRIEKHREKYFPIIPNDELQWEKHIEIHNSLNHAWSNIELKKGKYRIVLVTQYPEQYFFVYHYINRL